MYLDLCLLWQLVTVTPDRRQIYSKSKERPRIVGYKSCKWKAAAAKRQKARRRKGCTLWLQLQQRRLAVNACTFVRPPYKTQDIHCKSQVLALCPNTRGTLRFRVASFRLRATQTSSPPTPSPNTHKFSPSAHLYNHNLSRSHPQPQHVELVDAPQRLLQRTRSRHQPH